MSSMYDVIGRSEKKNLAYDPAGAEIIAIPCEPGNGVVARGTVVYRKESGLYAPAAAENVTETAYLAVLDEAVDTDADAKVAEDARAYRAGRMIRSAVTLSAGAQLSAAQELTLRKQGIVLSPEESTQTFNNEKG
ncbi:MAG: hypothetical protein ACI4PG_06535 [Candidatus Ventricola sp.]